MLCLGLRTRAGGGIRTRDQSFTKALLYRLSYPGMDRSIVAPGLHLTSHLWSTTQKMTKVWRFRGQTGCLQNHCSAN